jgi:hypothetical protein
MKNGRDGAHDFLDGLAKALDAATDGFQGPAMERHIRTLMREAEANGTKALMTGPEATFLNTFAVPVLFEELRAYADLSNEQARIALLNESASSMPKFSTHSPLRTAKTPFSKRMGISADAIYRTWKSEEKDHGLERAAPDIALRSPFPHRIVFEGKYIARGSSECAERELVRDIYQAFFYRGLPPVPETKRGRAEWNYDYACLLVFDATPKRAFRNAWLNLDVSVRSSFWDGANVYVMILGGKE